MSHSTLPWAPGLEGDPVVIGDANDYFVGMTLPAESDGASTMDYENAKFICLAANHHAKLFNALANLCEWDARMGFHDSPVWEAAREVLNAIRDEREGGAE